MSFVKLANRRRFNRERVTVSTYVPRQYNSVPCVCITELLLFRTREGINSKGEKLRYK